ncbi:MAG: hypothetical protein AAGF12_28870 [Myxococcota bacterium]
MAQADAQPIAKSGPPKRRLRNFLLDKGFQLKYTSMVVLVTVVVASVLGGFAYWFSKGQTESLSINMAMQPDLFPEVADDMEAWAEAEDRKVLSAVIGGILVLALAVGFTGIVVTHRVVGPAYKLKRLISHVADGHLEVAGRLRKGDELQDVFLAFERMVLDLRERQEDEVRRLTEAIEAVEKARAGGDETTLESAIEKLNGVRDEMQAELERSSMA